MEDTPPGEVADVDFGRLGLIHDPDTGHRRAVWALIVVLGYSRHCFVWPTFGQTLEDVIAGLESAWAFFGGKKQKAMTSHRTGGRHDCQNAQTRDTPLHSELKGRGWPAVPEPCPAKKEK